MKTLHTGGWKQIDQRSDKNRTDVTNVKVTNILTKISNVCIKFAMWAAEKFNFYLIRMLKNNSF